jgi:hypothetical protein
MRYFEHAYETYMSKLPPVSAEASAAGLVIAKDIPYVPPHRFTRETIRQMKRDRKAGLTNAELSKKYGVSDTACIHAMQRRT